MISTKGQIHTYERALFYADATGQQDQVKRINDLLRPLYMQQQLELWAKVAKSQFRRHGTIAHQLFAANS